MVINGAVVAKLHYLNQMSLFVMDQACDMMSHSCTVTEDCASPHYESLFIGLVLMSEKIKV